MQWKIFLRKTTPDEVAGVLKFFGTKKASDLYGISPKFVKISAEVIKTKVSLIINKSFQLGIFAFWKSGYGLSNPKGWFRDGMLKLQTHIYPTNI